MRRYAPDELAPLSQTGIEWLNVGLTVVDALDTLLIMGLDDEVGGCTSSRIQLTHSLKAPGSNP